MASKKEISKVAAVLNGEVSMAAVLSKSDIKKSAQYSLRNVILSTADVFAQTTKTFDREKFYTESGMVETENGWWPREFPVVQARSIWDNNIILCSNEDVSDGPRCNSPWWYDLGRSLDHYNYQCVSCGKKISPMTETGMCR